MNLNFFNDLEDKMKFILVQNFYAYGIDCTTYTNVCALIIKCVQVLNCGWMNRRVASTAMNRESSRSHAVFMLCVESKKKVRERDREREREYG